MSGRVDDYDFALPDELIAQRPPSRRGDARMMVLDRVAGTIAHRRFVDLVEFVRQDELLVLNDTRVLPARHFSDDGTIEFLFLEQVDPQAWKCLVKPGRKMRLGATTVLNGTAGRVEKIYEEGERLVRFERVIDPYRGGQIPLPPYLDRAADAEDAKRYQTVFAKEPGAVAAPTAGLHFTPEILARLPHTFVTLHVGAGTFRPVQSETIARHRMHSERFTITPAAAAAINAAERILAVGTTSVRVLEAALRRKGPARRAAGRDGYFHSSAVLFSRRGSAADEFSSAAFDAAHVGGGVCGSGVCFARLPGSGARALPLLQLRRLHA